MFTFYCNNLKASFHTCISLSQATSKALIQLGSGPCSLELDDRGGVGINAGEVRELVDKALWGETFIGREASQDVPAALCVRAIEAGFQVHISTGREPHRFAVLPVRGQEEVVEDAIAHGAL